MISSCLEKVKDKFNIYKRIKNINKNYDLYFNKKNKTYEVHDISNKFSSHCLTINPNDLDVRVLDKLLVTRKENMKKYFIQIEEENQKLQDNKIKQTLDLLKIVFRLLWIMLRENPMIFQLQKLIK